MTSSGNFDSITTNLTVDPNQFKLDSGTAFAWAGAISWPENSGPLASYDMVSNVWGCYGDADRSGAVNGGDLAIMGTFWNTASGMAWANGDYNGDGAVNGGDLALMGSNWNWTAAAPPDGGAVPEPATAGLLGLAFVGILARRRRKA